MNKGKIVYLACVIFVSISNAGNRIGIGGLLNYGQDNTSTSGSGYINAYNQRRDKFLTFLPIGEVYLEKKISSVTYYGGVYPRADFFVANLGLKRQYSKTESIDIFLTYNPFKSVWEDPLELNSNRKPTRQQELGGGVVLDHKYFSASTLLTYRDVATDRLGERYRDLRRDGIRIENRIYTNLRLGDGLFFKPGLLLDNFKAEGKASSYNGAGISLNLAYRKKDYIMNLLLNAEIQHYGKADPVFAKKREDESTSLLFSLTKKNFLQGNTYLYIAFGVNHRNSNLDFYDSKRLFLGIITGYNF